MDQRLGASVGLGHGGFSDRGDVPDLESLGSFDVGRLNEEPARICRLCPHDFRVFSASAKKDVIEITSIGGLRSAIARSLALKDLAAKILILRESKIPELGPELVRRSAGLALPF